MIIFDAVFANEVEPSEKHPEGFALAVVKTALASVSVVREFGPIEPDSKDPAKHALLFLMRELKGNLFVVTGPTGSWYVTNTSFQELVGMAEHEHSRCYEAALRNAKAVEKMAGGESCA